MGKGWRDMCLICGSQADFAIMRSDVRKETPFLPPGNTSGGVLMCRSCLKDPDGRRAATDQLFKDLLSE